MKGIATPVLLLAAVTAIVGAVVVVLRHQPSGMVVQVHLPTATAAAPVELKVYLTGAVRNPGVYAVADGTRLSELVEAAGGPAEDADLAAVNLAVRVRDEDHWHIPKQGESAPATLAQRSARAGMININSANVEELKALPGIGDVKAQAIVRYREANGPFASVDELLDVQGIGPATLESIKDLVEVR